MSGALRTHIQTLQDALQGLFLRLGQDEGTVAALDPSRTSVRTGSRADILVQPRASARSSGMPDRFLSRDRNPAITSIDRIFHMSVSVTARRRLNR
jgi:hypothetical protein